MLSESLPMVKSEQLKLWLARQKSKLDKGNQRNDFFADDQD